MRPGEVTIREYIKGQAQSAKRSGAGFAFAIAIILLAFLSSKQVTYSHKHIGPYVVLGIALVFALSFRLMRRLERALICPKCSAPLGRLSSVISDNPQITKINFCPQCGINLDGPMPETPAPEPATPQ